MAVAAVLAALMGWSSAEAALMVVEPASVTASSYYVNPPLSRVPDLTRDGSGLSDATIVETGDPVPVVWPTHSDATGDPVTMWLSTFAVSDPSPTITWDLGAVYELAGFHLWNYNESAGGGMTRGISNATVLVSSDNFVTTNYVTSLTFAIAPGSSSYTGDAYALAATGRYVRFADVVDYGDPTFSAGLAEIRFEAVTVPEPSTVTLLGASIVITWWRRRRSRD